MPHPTTSTGRGATAVQPPYLFVDAVLGPQNLLHHDTVSGYGLAASSTATPLPPPRRRLCFTHRKSRNREHLRTFSFYFRTSKCCNPIPPFAYYKRGGRDPRPKRRKDDTTQWQCTKHTLKHSNTPTHRDLGDIPLSTSLYPLTTSTSV
jgi:hypothetical protein